MSDFNKIMAFQQMMPYLNKEQQDNLATTLGMELQEIERRLVGKNKEDEFILILLFMEVCKSITAFDEGVSQLLKTATSDLLVELQNEKKFMLERPLKSRSLPVKVRSREESWIWESLKAWKFM